MQLFNTSENQAAVASLEVARTFVKRFVGLLGRKDLPQGTGLLLTKCNSVHMFFMRFAIDVVFIDEAMCVVKIVPDLKQWRLASCSKARHTLELPSGEAARCGLEIGNELRIIEDDHRN